LGNVPTQRRRIFNRDHMELIRADILATLQGVAQSRSHAADLIKRGLVVTGGKIITKPGSLVPRYSQLFVEPEQDRFVSRGGEKLAEALISFDVVVTGKIALDCGASSGGFTDCLLQNGALRVYAVDVGYGQLSWKLRNDSRVIVMERINLRNLKPEAIPEKVDLITLDMSFISLKLIFPVVKDLILPEGEIIALIKPQFEAGKKQVGSGGVVRDPAVHRSVLSDIAAFATGQGWTIRSIISSPLLGPKGNREFLMHLKIGPNSDPKKVEDWITNALDRNCR
jgi:23S rRNA (cytidine1920-2'-O)/16S rRNA (cytidine1409-2'-O)-methyltransferase